MKRNVYRVRLSPRPYGPCYVPPPLSAQDQPFVHWVEQKRWWGWKSLDWFNSQTEALAFVAGHAHPIYVVS